MIQTLVTQISDIQKSAEKSADHIETIENLKAFEQEFLGKKSILNELSKGMKDFPADQRKEAGQAVGGLRKVLENIFYAKKEVLEKAALNEKLKGDWIDVTKNVSFEKGGLHPISKIQRQVEKTFSSMGFTIADGPQIETEWHNFDALNIPEYHPARDMQDTFWIKTDGKKSAENFVLRTQTSNVQIRTMQKYGAPVRVIAPGRVFRNEDIDATHDAVFYQVEGLLVDENISLAHLKGTIKTMLSELFGKPTKIRLRPGYFPFVEPGFEIDMWWEYTDKEGNPQAKWLEFMGAGMVHPNVLKNCDIDPEKYTGFAFGFGLTRLAMMKYGIDDIRLLSSQKIDFLKQF